MKNLILALISFCCLSASAALTNQHTLYIDPNGNDSTGKKGLKEFPFKTGAAAAAIASVGDTIYYNPGTYIETIWYKAPTNGTVTGSGKRATIVIDQFTNAVPTPLIALSDNCYVGNMTISNYYADPIAAGIPASCIGSHQSNGTSGYTNALLENLELWGGSDTWYIRHTNATQGVSRNCDFHGWWDIVAMFGTGGHSNSFYGCTFTNTQVTAHGNAKDCIVFDSTAANKSNAVFCVGCTFAMRTTVAQNGAIIGDTGTGGSGVNSATMIACTFDNQTLQNLTGDGSFSENSNLKFTACTGFNVVEVGNSDDGVLGILNYDTNIVGTIQFGGQRHRADAPRITSGYSLETGRDLSFLSDSNVFSSLIVATNVATQWAGNTGNNILAAATTFFYAPNGNSITNVFTTDTSAVTRNVTTRTWRLGNLYAVRSGAGGVGHTSTVTIMTNGVATTIVASLNNTLTGNDTTHTVTIFPGVEIGVQIVTPASDTPAKFSWAFEGR